MNNKMTTWSMVLVMVLVTGLLAGCRLFTVN